MPNRPQLPESDTYGPSQAVWAGVPLDQILGWGDRNVGFGFFDDFEHFCPTTLVGPYKFLATDGGITQLQIADTAEGTAGARGAMTITFDAGAAYDEGFIQRGCGLSAPYKFDHDLCFEARFKVSAITAAKWSLFLGLTEVGGIGTNHIFADAGTIADYNMVGFCHLVAEGAAWDGSYKADGQTHQLGSTKTKLDTLHTMVADTYVKLGFRYTHSPRTLDWFVDGVKDPDATLTQAELDAATFPDDVFMAPIFGAIDVVQTALVMTLDWWGCVQLL